MIPQTGSLPAHYWGANFEQNSQLFLFNILGGRLGLWSLHSWCWELLGGGLLLVACCLLSRAFPIHKVHKSHFFKDRNKYLSNLNFYQHARLINVQTFSDESIKLQEYGDRIPKDLLLKLVTRQIFSLCRNAGISSKWKFNIYLNAVGLVVTSSASTSRCEFIQLTDFYTLLHDTFEVFNQHCLKMQMRYLQTNKVSAGHEKKMRMETKWF